jgi:hypothetical protein
MSLFAAVIFILAILLTFVEEWCRDHGRPAWLLEGIEALSVLLFITDGIAILCTCTKLIIELMRDLIANHE